MLLEMTSMKLNDKITAISFVWWLLQGALLLLNELRVLFEYNYLNPSFFALSIFLVVISFLLRCVKNRKIVLLLSLLLLLYSVVSLIFLSALFILEARNNWIKIFLVVPILNILLSILLMYRSLRKEIKE